MIKSANQKYKILIVQNDDFLGGMYKMKFDADGRFECVSMLHPGEHFIRTALEIKPDLILLGIIFDGADGFRVMEELRNNSATRNIPVMFFTNLSTQEDVERGMRLGAVDYIIMARHSPAEVLEICAAYLKKFNPKSPGILRIFPKISEKVIFIPTATSR